MSALTRLASSATASTARLGAGAAREASRRSARAFSGASLTDAASSVGVSRGETSSRPAWSSGLTVADLPRIPTNLYYSFPEGLVPEAEPEFWEDAAASRGLGAPPPRAGCEAATAEWAWSGERALLARASTAALAADLEAGRRTVGVLEGWSGSGKSVALLAAVGWARANGWIALYIPSARALTRGGSWSRAADGLIDNASAARSLLRGLVAAHSADLEGLRTAGGAPALERAQEGLDSGSSPAAAVAAALDIRDALVASEGRRVLLAVDDYDALYHDTTYGEAAHPLHRRPVVADELRLAREMRVLERAPPATGAVLVARGRGRARVPAGLALPAPRGARVPVQPFTPDEASAVLAYAEATGAVPPGTRDERAVRRALALAGGNARDLRERTLELLLADEILGPRGGHKVEKAAGQKLARGA